MKPLLLVLGAFLLQSCYTVVYYTPDEYASPTIDYGGPIPPDEPVPPYCPPQPIYLPPASTPMPSPQEPTRPRTGSSTHEPVTTAPISEPPVRQRVPASSDGGVQPTKVDQAAPVQGVERQRVGSQPPQSNPQRPR